MEDKTVGGGRNDLCVCGSGKKYKKCCLGKHQEREIANSKLLEEKRKEAAELLKGYRSMVDNLLNIVKSKISVLKLKDLVVEVDPKDERVFTEEFVGILSIKENKILTSYIQHSTGKSFDRSYEDYWNRISERV